MSDLRQSISPERLEYLDNIAQIVAKLYLDKKQDELLGNEPNELREAVYSLGQAYMLLYSEILAKTPIEDSSG